MYKGKMQLYFYITHNNHPYLPFLFVYVASYIIEYWATYLGMKLNASKCHIMSIHRRKHSPYMYELGETIMSSVLQEKYLFFLGPSSVATKASQKLGFLIYNLKDNSRIL